MISPNFIERDFAGAARRFQLPAADPRRLYRGIEAEGATLSELAKRAAAGNLGAGHVESILAHGLSRGHPVTLINARAMVRAEMDGKPLAEFLGLAVAVVTAAFAGPDE